MSEDEVTGHLLDEQGVMSIRFVLADGVLHANVGEICIRPGGVLEVPGVVLVGNTTSSDITFTL